MKSSLKVYFIYNVYLLLCCNAIKYFLYQSICTDFNTLLYILLCHHSDLLPHSKSFDDISSDNIYKLVLVTMVMMKWICTYITGTFVAATGAGFWGVTRTWIWRVDAWTCPRSTLCTTTTSHSTGIPFSPGSPFWKKYILKMCWYTWPICDVKLQITFKGYVY